MTKNTTPAKPDPPTGDPGPQAHFQGINHILAPRCFRLGNRILFTEAIDWIEWVEVSGEVFLHMRNGDSVRVGRESGEEVWNYFSNEGMGR